MTMNSEVQILVREYHFRNKKSNVNLDIQTSRNTELYELETVK
jgi:hypothetical protein